MITKLTNADKSLLRQIVGKVHVYTSDSDLVSHLRGIIDFNQCSQACQKAIERYAIKEHKANRQICIDYRL